MSVNEIYCQQSSRLHVLPKFYRKSSRDLLLIDGDHPQLLLRQISAYYLKKRLIYGPLCVRKSQLAVATTLTGVDFKSKSLAVVRQKTIF